MVQSVSSFKGNNLQLGTSNFGSNRGYLKEVNAPKPIPDLFTKSKNMSQVSFTSIHSVDWYGTQADRDALSYKIKLTPEAISSAYTERSVMQNYGKLLEELGHVNNAFIGVMNIRNELMQVLMDRFKEIKRMNPEGSRIPVGGIIPQIGGVFSGEFEKEIRYECDKVIGEHGAVIDKYWNKGMNPICTDYLSASQALQEKVYYTSQPEKLKEAIKNGHEKIDTTYYKIYNEAMVPIDKILRETRIKVINGQDTKQTLRTALKILGVGLLLPI